GDGALGRARSGRGTRLRRRAAQSFPRCVCHSRKPDQAVRRSADREARPHGNQTHCRRDRPRRRGLNYCDPKTGALMTSVTETGRRRGAPALGTFERYLTVWVALCIGCGAQRVFFYYIKEKGRSAALGRGGHRSVGRGVRELTVRV